MGDLNVPVQCECGATATVIRCASCEEQTGAFAYALDEICTRVSESYRFTRAELEALLRRAWDAGWEGKATERVMVGFDADAQQSLDIAKLLDEVAGG